MLGADRLRSAGSRSWLVGLLLFGVIVVAVRASRSAWYGNDYGAYHAAARAVVAGANIFDTVDSIDGQTYIYPPTLAVLVVPFTVLSESLAGVAWTLLNLALLLWILRLCLEHAPASQRGALGWVVLACAVLASPIDNNFLNGQANVLLLACIVLAWRCVVHERWFASGVAIGLAASLKATPLIFLGYYLFQKSGRGVLGVLAGMVLFAVVVPGFVMGFDDALDANREWVDRFAMGAAHGMEFERGGFREPETAAVAPAPCGYSLRAFLYRWLSPTRIANRPTSPSINVLSLDRGTTEWIYRGAALVMLATAFFVGLRRRVHAPDRFREFALVATTMVLIAPYSRKAMFLLCLPAALWLAHTAHRKRDPRLLSVLVGSLLLFAVAMYTGITVVKEYALGVGFYFLAAFALWLTLLLRRPDEPAPATIERSTRRDTDVSVRAPHPAPPTGIASPS